MKGIRYRFSDLADCANCNWLKDAYVCVGGCTGIIAERFDTDFMPDREPEGSIPWCEIPATEEQEWIEGAIRRYGEFSPEQLVEKALYDADGKNDCLGRMIINGKVRRYDSGVDLAIINAEEEEGDADYGDWCLQNNFVKLDERAGFYVCGENLMDDLWQEWVEDQLGLTK